MVSPRLALGLLFLTSGLAACGGGGSGNSEFNAASPQIVNLSRQVAIQGCVLDRFYIPKAAAVQARSSDGRLVNRVLTDDYGVFSIAVPVSETVAVSVDKLDGDTLHVSIGTEPRAVGTCLID